MPRVSDVMIYFDMPSYALTIGTCHGLERGKRGGSEKKGKGKSNNEKGTRTMGKKERNGVGRGNIYTHVCEYQVSTYKSENTGTI